MKQESHRTKFHKLSFDDSFTRLLPADPIRDDLRPRKVSGACYSFVQPTPLPDPKLLAWSDSLALSLGIDPASAEDPETAAVLTGNKLLPGMRPYAARYGGHQFGHWAGQLGDGRAITLGEIFDSEGRRQEIQLKGAGLTPYSRHADGRAVLRSSMREFLCSEAMYHLGVPTTRALSLVKSSEKVIRDMFYDGHPQWEHCAVVARVAPCFVRFGHFEILSFQNEHELLRQLADYVISHHFPGLDLKDPEVYSKWFAEICQRTAVMIAHWLRVGYVHGVMNTDNMSILGQTIDYGPYGWLDIFDPHWTPNTTDAGQKRYRFANQATIAQWNLLCLGEALLPLVQKAEPIEQGLEIYRQSLNANHQQMMAYKLGWQDIKSQDDLDLIKSLQQIMQLIETDMTIFYRQLSNLVSCSETTSPDEMLQIIKPAFYSSELSIKAAKSFTDWLQQFVQRSRHHSLQREERIRLMDANNPKYILRNYLVQEAIDAEANGDASKINILLKVMQNPYAEQIEFHEFAVKRPEWARFKSGCSALSCSS
ncbi:MAG: protein adenylyltransferase SelO [Oligoflexus sp.]